MGRGEEHLLQAARLQDVPLVQKLIHRGRGKLLGSSKKVNINCQDSEGFSALHQAAVHGNIDIAYALLDGNVNVDLQDKKGLRPLHYSAWKGKVEVVSALLASGASCNSPGLTGCAPLHLAAQYGHAQVCKMLLQYGADLSARQSDGCSPLDLACEFGRKEVVSFFLQNNESAALVEPLQSQKSDTDYSSISSPLHLAAKNGHIDIIRVLLQGGVDINWRTASGTCLHEAVANEKPEIVQLLIDCGIDVNIRSGLGQTALDLTKKLTKTPAIAEITRKLAEAQPRILQVYAINDFQNILDRKSLAFTKGTIITVLEQNRNGNWKGRIDGANGEPPTIGTFPASFVQPCRQGPMAGSDDSGIHPNDEESLPQWNNPHISRSSIPPSKPHLLPSHNYINLDPRSKQQQAKIPLVAPNVVNPSYEDVICSQPDRPSKKPHVSPDRPIIASRKGIDLGISRNRPSISNPGYEDVLIDHGGAGDSSSSAASGRTNEAPSRKVEKRPSKRAAMQAQAHDSRIHHWLASFGMEQYAPNFLHHGYDLPTAARASLADLSAIRVVSPAHRKVIADRASMLRRDPSSRLPFTEQLPRSIWDWLHNLGLDQYTSAFANANVDTVENAAQTTWEDLQEMGVTKLGHQKKLMIAITNLVHTLKRRAETQNPPPAVRPKPGTEKKEKSNQPLTSFKESPGLSSELQKALSRRQKIIDDADSGAPPGVAQHNGSPSEPPQSAAVPSIAVATDAAAKIVRRPSGSRGPPPNPPKRTSSVSIDDNPSLNSSSENQIRNARAAAVSKQVNGNKSVSNGGTHGLFTQNAPPQARSPGTTSNQPFVAPKTKPVVMRKPLKQTPTQSAGPPQVTPQFNGAPTVVSKQPPPVSQKPSRAENGAHFDLSALDGVDRNVEPTRPPGAIQPGHGAHPNKPESSDDFDWPAPPPMQHEAPSTDFPLPPPTQNLASKAPTSPMTSAPMSTTPNYFEDEDPGTVKRRPVSGRTPDVTPTSSHELTSPPRGVEEPPLLPAKSTASNRSYSPSKPAEPTVTDRFRDDNPAPPLPEKVGKTTEIIPDLNSPDANPVATRQALDDISAMFDGLAQEFDDLLI